VGRLQATLTHHGHVCLQRMQLTSSDCAGNWACHCALQCISFLSFHFSIPSFATVVTGSRLAIGQKTSAVVALTSAQIFRQFFIARSTNEVASPRLSPFSCAMYSYE
jgi:hypothetical protein